QAAIAIRQDFAKLQPDAKLSRSYGFVTRQGATSPSAILAASSSGAKMGFERFGAAAWPISAVGTAKKGVLRMSASSRSKVVLPLVSLLAVTALTFSAQAQQGQ